MPFLHPAHLPGPLAQLAPGVRCMWEVLSKNCLAPETACWAPCIVPARV